jgi:hypothetical protein
LVLFRGFTFFNCAGAILFNYVYTCACVKRREEKTCTCRRSELFNIQVLVRVLAVFSFVTIYRAWRYHVPACTCFGRTMFLAWIQLGLGIWCPVVSYLLHRDRVVALWFIGQLLICSCAVQYVLGSDSVSR